MAIESIAAIIVAFLAALPGIASFYKQFKQEEYVRRQLESDLKKSDVEITDMLIDAVPLLIEPLKSRILDLEIHVKRLEGEIDSLEIQHEKLRKMNRTLCKGVMSLVEQLVANNIKPVFDLNNDLCSDI